MCLIFYILSTYAVSCLITMLNNRYNTKYEIKVLKCPFCLGMWTGLILFLFNDYTNLFTFEVTICNAVLMSLIAGATTYLLMSLVDDNGFKIDRK